MKKRVNLLVNSRFLLLYFFIFYFLFRILILNFNSAEWGDSYRILRATSFLETGEYPENEKRPPFFSVVLLLGNFFGGEVVGGRVVMVGISILILFFFNLLIKEVFSKIEDLKRVFILLLLGLNPLYLYWSMRIYADSLFLLITLILFYCFYRFQKYWWNQVLLAFISVIGVYTRFEGYILIATVLTYFGLMFLVQKNLLYLQKIFLFGFFSLIFLTALINFDFFHYQNPLTSSYFEEAESRSFQFRELGPTFLQLIFVTAGIIGAVIMGWEWKKLLNFFHSHPIISIYTTVFILLSAVWFPAVPRLFLQILPFLILGFFVCLQNFIKEDLKYKFKRNFILLSTLLFVTYIIGQLLFKTQLLLTNRIYFTVFLTLSLLSLIFLILKNLKLFYLLFFSMIISWTAFVIIDHSKTFDALSRGVFFLKNIKKESDKVLTNDVSSLSGFYFEPDLVYSGKLDSGKGIEDLISKEKPQYVLYTNEHNPDLEFIAEKYPFFKVLKEFSFEDRGRKFRTLVLEVSYN